ncbi:EAL domain-containing protein [Gracilibacillus timonensis]|uniref:EAL domain-containing protein n=1 Tax=Gracilibacillus timonensis TaxID=1816696 RepID=UPI000825F0F0|nr:EAL domain-containing protein [Gracilibacillus timonensis]
MSIAKLNDLIDNEKFTHQFQALFDLQTLSTIGYEAFITSDLFKNTEILFEKASNSSRFFELEMRSIKKAIQSYDRLSTEKKLFVNIYPINLMHSSMLQYLEHFRKKTRVAPDQIVLEVKEADITKYSPSFVDSLRSIQHAGYLIGFDDVGKQASSLHAIVELKPDFIKMNRFFAKNLAQSSQKQEMVRSIVTYCFHTNTKLVLKGIEVPEDLEMAKSIGISIVQGYLLARPEPLSVIQQYETKQADDMASNE